MARRRVVWLAGTVAIAAVVLVLGLCTGESRPTLGVALTYRLEGNSSTHDLDRALEVVRRRLDRAKGLEASARRRDDQLIVELVGEPDTIARARLLLANPAVLGFHLIDDGAEFWTRTFELVQTARRSPGIDVRVESWPRTPDVPARPGRADRYLRAESRDELTDYLARLHTDRTLAPLPDRRVAYEQIQIAPGRPGWRTQVIVRAAELTITAITRAEVIEEPQTGRPTVRVEFDDTGREAFGTLTAGHVGDKIAIVLDGAIQSTPVIMEAIRGGQVSITMGGNDPQQQREEATRLAATLGAGALPAPLAIVDERQFLVDGGDGVRWNVLAILGLAGVAFAIWTMMRRRT